MNEIKDLVATWEKDIINQDGLQAAINAIKLLIIKVEELENKIKDLG